MYLQNNFKTRIRKYSIILLPVIGVIIIASMVGIVWFWETAGRELYFYKEVIILKQDVKKGTIITEDLLEVEKIEAEKMLDQAVQNKKEIIGLEAKHFIPKKSQLHPYFFEAQGLLTDEDTYIVKIPNEWLYSIPNSLRRKDYIVFYPINEKSDKEVKELINNNDDGSNIDTFNAKDSEAIKKNLGKSVLTTRVAYVKDSANREVVTVSHQERLDGSSVISEVLVLISQEQLKQLEEAVNNGNKFILMHLEGEK